MDINQDEICYATSKSFHGSSVQTKYGMSEEMLDAALEMLLGDGTISFWSILYVWAQAAWNESVKRMENSSYMMSVDNIKVWECRKKVIRFTKNGILDSQKEGET